MLSKFFEGYNKLYPREEVKAVAVETPIETFRPTEQFQQAVVTESPNQEEPEAVITEGE